MGGQQVGKAALSGWREVLGPALVGASDPSPEKIGIWPFSGRLCDLLGPSRLVVVETYPAECYRRIGIAFPRPQSGQKTGKRVQRDRSDQAPATTGLRRQARLNPDLQAQLGDGRSRADGRLVDASPGCLGY
jgi:hypothetical protein